MFSIVMIQVVGYAGLLVVIAAISIFIVKVVWSRSRLKFYEKQGIQTYFNAKLGFFGLFNVNEPENKTTSNLELIKTLTNKKDDKGLLASNMINGTTINIFIYNCELIKEFLLKEEYFEKNQMIQTPKKYNLLGLFMQEGDALIKSKSLFMKIFRYEGIANFTPKICKIVEEEFANYNKAKGVNKHTETLINLDDLFHPIMKRITNLLMFGQERFSEDSPQEQLYRLMEELFETLLQFRYSPLYILMPTLSTMYSLSSTARKLYRINQQQADIFARLMAEHDDIHRSNDSIFDRMKMHNVSCIDDGQKSEVIGPMEAAGNYNLFVFAGSDTSQNTTKMALCHMSSIPELKAFIEGINSNIYDSENKTTAEVLERCNDLEKWTKEALRMHNPASRQIGRKALKDIKLGKFEIRKGDRVSILQIGLNFDKSVYSNPEEFDVNRFDSQREKSIPRYQYIPFSVGKRNCLGRHLGELMVKLMVTQFCLHYNFTKPADAPHYKNSRITTQVDSPLLTVKLK